MGYRVKEVLSGPIDTRKWIRVKESGVIFICNRAPLSYLAKTKRCLDDVNRKIYHESELENVIVEEIEDEL